MVIVPVNQQQRSKARLEELAFRLRCINKIRAGLHDKQRKFVDSASRYKLAVCTRRAGKTHAVAADIVISALKYPGGLMVYIALTKETATLLIKDIIEGMCKSVGLQVEYKSQGGYMFFGGGAMLIFRGADKPPEIEKLRGLKLRRAYTDESASFGGHVEKMVYSVLGPALTDLAGVQVMVGTPGYLCAGTFYDAATKKNMSFWDRHAWSILDNEHFPLWAGEPDWRKAAKDWLDNKRIEENLSEDDPTFLREWCGIWRIDPSTLIYKFDKGRDLYEQLPKSVSEWKYVIGVDLGYDDDTAFVIVAFSQDSPCVYEIASEATSGMSVSEVAGRLKKLVKQYKPIHVVVDTGGLGKMIAEDFRTKYSIACEPAEKKDKFSFVEALNSDFRLGYLKIHQGSMTQLELSTIQWDKKRKKEDEAFSNHRADALLYAWRRCLHYLYRPKKAFATPGSQEYYDQVAEEMLERRVKQAQKRARKRR